jgi:hypothetical protein
MYYARIIYILLWTEGVDPKVASNLLIKKHIVISSSAALYLQSVHSPPISVRGDDASCSAPKAPAPPALKSLAPPPSTPSLVPIPNIIVPRLLHIHHRPTDNKGRRARHRMPVSTLACPCVSFVHTQPRCVSSVLHPPLDVADSCHAPLL